MATKFIRSTMSASDCGKGTPLAAIRKATCGTSAVLRLPVSARKADSRVAFWVSTAVMAVENGADLDNEGKSFFPTTSQRSVDIIRNNENYIIDPDTGKARAKTEKMKAAEAKKAAEEAARKPKTKAEYQAIIDRLLKEQAVAPEA